MDFKVVQSFKLDGTIRIGERLFALTRDGIYQLNILEVNAVRHDVRRQFIQDVREFW